MAIKVIFAECDNCTETREFDSLEEFYGAGWIDVRRGDLFGGDVKKEAFCDRYCLKEHLDREE